MQGLITSKKTFFFPVTILFAEVKLEEMNLYYIFICQIELDSEMLLRVQQIIWENFYR